MNVSSIQINVVMNLIRKKIYGQKSVIWYSVCQSKFIFPFPFGLLDSRKNLSPK